MLILLFQGPATVAGRMVAERNEQSAQKDNPTRNFASFISNKITR